ncbi:MAG: GNAT family N-acetyltransferase [Thiolinea sp.]
MMNIRKIGPNDAAAFSALRLEVIEKNPVQMGLSHEEELTRTLDSFREQLTFTPPNAMFGGFSEGKLVATAAVGYTSKFPSSRHKMVMWGVFTSPRFRRKGFSRGVVEAAIQNAFRNGVRRINLQVYVPNEPALNLYKSIGFTEYGVEPEAIHLDGKYYDGVHMTILNKQA